METKSSTGRPGVSLKLAVTVLFGERFLLDASPEFLLSLEQNAETWGKMLLNIWELTHPTNMPVLPVMFNGHHPVSEPSTTFPQQIIASSPQQETRTTNALPSSATPQARQAPASNHAKREVSSSSVPIATQSSMVALQVFDPQIDSPLETDNQQKSLSSAEIKHHLIELLVEKTGYPAEVFEDHLDFEADLGIDSVKQLEIMNTMREEYHLSVDEDFLLRDYTTIETATDYIVSQMKA